MAQALDLRKGAKVLYRSPVDDFWQEGELVVWDNRCVLHRATPFDTTRYKRLMQRTTVSGDPAEAALLRERG